MERNQNQGPAGGVTPHLLIRDGRAGEAVSFYQVAFGARELNRVPSLDGRLMHCHLEVNGGSVMLNDDFPEHHHGKPGEAPAGVTLHLQVGNADELWTDAMGAGARVIMPLEDRFWGDRYGVLEDPFGHRWSIGAALQT